ncbi:MULTISPECIES: MFS transporter [Bosea]|jgi:MFS family permease|uniref:MFS transporter n=1 Tax=Bosea TaxID=85413 RepID=UPI00214F7B97|nr:MULTISPECIES: MFS transporter [Bosea]MCR4520275.1 MFS transporter [Bosea sp. 47.2.35]MDR6828699.1 MFS family permease [Bosea robiniae]MDR6895358.1 MFS family permease [Bosea sp. BE109]MDR7138754.1 MFS family permease [Bosea sp. BE168]MDR7175271.1 MFS family permease [Bosea sp. BE271]
MSQDADRYQPDSSYAWLRLAVALVIGTVACVGSWSVVVVLPAMQGEFGTLRAGASLPYTFAMLGFGAGNIIMGRVADRYGIMVPIVMGAFLLAAGYSAAAMSQSLWQFALAHGLLIGMGSAAGFSPLISDLSHWFRKHRGLAVVCGASGSYLAGVFWPQVITWGMANHGWRATHFGIAIVTLVVLLPLAPFFRRQPTAATMAAAEASSAGARGDLGLSAGQLQLLLCVAGFACCVAMAMPQVHIVAYCGDLGYGVARGAEMLSLMMLLGIVSRIGSGFVADRIGGVATLALGSLMQGVALFLYLWFDGLQSLYVVSGIFGLFQGGIVPMYAVVIREYLPAKQAGVRIGLVMSVTVLGMAFGGYLSGLIFDYFSSYRMAFLNGLAWNLVNLGVVCWLMLRARQRPTPPLQVAG